MQKMLKKSFLYNVVSASYLATFALWDESSKMNRNMEINISAPKYAYLICS